MTSPKQLLEAHSKYREEVAPALETLTSETLRSDGPMNAVAWVVTVVGSFLLCLGLLLAVTGG